VLRNEDHLKELSLLSKHQINLRLPVIK